MTDKVRAADEADVEAQSYRIDRRSSHGKNRRRRWARDVEQSEREAEPRQGAVTTKSAVMTNKMRKRQEKRGDTTVAFVSVVVLNLLSNNKRPKQR